jgi:PKD repeat protein
MKKVLFLFIFLNALDFLAQSTAIINVSSDMIFDLNGRKGKSLIPLFDGNLATTFDLTSVNENQFVLPFHSFLVLPNVYNNIAFDYYDSFGAGGNISVNFYNASKTLLANYPLSDNNFQVWKNLNATNLNTLTNVRFMEVVILNQTGLNTLFEFKIYGDSVAPAASIYSGTAILPKADIGAKGHGINTLDHKLYNYNVTDTTRIIDRLAKTIRVGYEGPRFNIYPDAYTSPMDSLITDLSRFGIDHLNTRVLNLARANNLDIQLYHTGGSIKNLTAGQASTSNFSFVAQAQDFKYIDPAANPLLPASWNGLANLYSKLAALYGTNTNATISKVQGGISTAGQGGVKILEVGNEWNADWKSNGAIFYHNPEVYYTALKQVYQAVKLQDSNMKVYSAALTYMDLSYWKALYFHHYWKTNANTPYPVDGINMNLYINSDLDGQGGNSASTAISPEAWNLQSRLTSLQQKFNLMFPNVPLVISETGFATDDGSPVDVDPIGARTDRQVSADLELRFKAIAQSNNLVDRIIYYAFFEDGTVNFNTMSAIQDQYNGGGVGAYSGSALYPIAYALSNELAVEQNYKFRSQIIKNGSITGAWQSLKNHNSNPYKKLYKIWKGSSNGSTVLDTVIVGSNALSANLYKVNYSNYLPSSSSATINNGQVIVMAEETMQWLEVQYPVPQAPIANFSAPDTACINAPINLTDLSSNAPTGWAWTMTGSNTPISSLPNPSITYSTSGNYTVTLIATNAVGMSAPTSKTVTILPLPTVSLTPSSSNACVNSIINLIGNPVGGTFSGIGVSGNSLNTGTIATTLNPTYAYTDSITGCTNSASTSISVSLCSGLDQKQKDLELIKLYPNPNNGNFKIELISDAKISISDAIGHTLLNEKFKQGNHIINLENAANGLYFIKITNAEQQITKPMIINK